MKMILFALAVTVVAVGQSAIAQTAASEKVEVMATVRQFVDAFNKGDTKAAAAACTEEMSIVDEFPPYEWHGAGACSKWMSDYDVNAKANGITDGIVTLSKPRHIDVEGDRSYVVVPSNYTYMEKGKPVKEIGSVFTLALHKSETGWRITGWAWAKN